jgi:hypothetical protein
MALNDEGSPQGGSAAPDAAPRPPAGSPDSILADSGAECARLRQEVRRLEQERDEYRHMLYQILAKYFDAVHGELTEERLRDMIANGKWFSSEEVWSEIEQLGKEK